MPRTDNVQIRIDFITDESKEFARTIKDTERFRNELKKAQKDVETLTKEQQKLAAQGKDTTAIALRLAEAERRVEDSLQGIAEAGRDISKIDLSKLMPSQLVTRANQLRQSLQFIPAGHPERAQMEADLRRINAQLADMNGKTRGVSSEMAALRTQSGGLSGVFQSIVGNFLGGGILGIVQTVVSGIWSLGKTALQASADMEGLKVAVEVFLGSGAAATKFLKDIQKFAAETPFEFPELAEAGKKLLAFGYDGDSAMKLLKKLGDVASAAQVPIGELAAIVGKAKLGQKIQGEELNQLADRGINVFPQLAKVLGTTEDKIKKLGSEGKIAYSDLEKAITMATEKGGQFYGMMEKQSQTFNGLISTLSDNFGQFVQSIFGGIGEGLKPVIKGLSDFFGQLTDLIRDGKKPVGEYAEVIQYVARTLSILGNVFGIVWEVGKLVLGYFLEQIKAAAWLSNRIVDLIGWFVGLSEQAKKIPIIGAFFKPILDAIGLLSDLLSNASATFAGFRAAAQQAITNIQVYFRALAIDAEIVGTKLAAALSFDATVKANSQKQIAALEAEKAAMFKAGKTVEQAYTEGRNAFKATQNKVEKDDGLAKKAAKPITPTADPKDAEKAEKDRLSRVKKALELELDARDIAFRKEALVNEIAFLNKEKNESDFNKKLLQLESEKYTEQIKIFDTYQSAFGAKSKEFQDLEIKKLEAQKKLIETNVQLRPRSSEEVQTLGTRQATGVQSDVNDPIAKIQANAEVEKSLIQQKFGDILRFEQEFEIKRLEIQSQAFAAQLAVLKANGAEETAEYKRIGKEKEAVDKAMTDNKVRLAEIEKNIEQAKGQIAQDVFAVGIELLSADENARKKHAGAIKAFQIAQIVTSGVLEVQKIWATVAEYGPAGPIIGAILTAITVARSAAAINRVGSQKFALGGVAKMGIFGGNSHSGGGTKGMFEDGTAVEVEKDEAFVVVNKKNTPLLSALSFINSANGNGKSFYGEQGFALNLNTTPRFSTGVTPQYNQGADMSRVEEKLEAYLSKMDTWANNFEVSLPLSKLEGKQREISLDRTEASY